MGWRSEDTDSLPPAGNECGFKGLVVFQGECPICTSNKLISSDVIEANISRTWHQKYKFCCRFCGEIIAKIREKENG